MTNSGRSFRQAQKVKRLNGNGQRLSVRADRLTDRLRAMGIDPETL
ncbi:MAG TPA: hypothetical protein V6D18_07680 [Thermosynechococcaceae cyanobacterium]